MNSIKSTTMKKFLFALILTCPVLFSKCGNVASSKLPVINPPFKGVDVFRNVFTLNPKTDNEFFTSSGTRIFVPQGAIVDNEGNPIEKNAELSFKEYHDLADVIVSGIPMVYDSAGTRNFVTAGMFDIRAETEGNPLKIAKDAFVQVDMASYKEGNEFNFYQLDEQNGNWGYLGTNQPIANERKQVQMQSFKDDNLIHFNIDYSSHPELQPFQDLQWVYAGSVESNSPFENKWVFEEKWRKIELETLDGVSGKYMIHLRAGSKRFSFEACPYILGDRDETISQLNADIANLDAVILAQKEREEAIALQADILRSFKIRSFGTCNWDTAKERLASQGFQFLDATMMTTNRPVSFSERVYCVDKTDDLMLNQMGGKWTDFVYSPEHDQAVFAVLDNNRVAICSSTNVRSSVLGSAPTFKLTTQEQKISSVADLRKVISQL